MGEDGPSSFEEAMSRAASEHQIKSRAEAEAQAENARRLREATSQASDRARRIMPEFRKAVDHLVPNAPVSRERTAPSIPFDPMGLNEIWLRRSVRPRGFGKRKSPVETEWFFHRWEMGGLNSYPNSELWSRETRGVPGGDKNLYYSPTGEFASSPLGCRITVSPEGVAELNGDYASSSATPVEFAVQQGIFRWMKISSSGADYHHFNDVGEVLVEAIDRIARYLASKR